MVLVVLETLTASTFLWLPLHIARQTFIFSLRLDCITNIWQNFPLLSVYMHVHAQKCRTISNQGRKSGLPRNFDCFFIFLGCLIRRQPFILSLSLDFIADMGNFEKLRYFSVKNDKKLSWSQTNLYYFLITKTLRRIVFDYLSCFYKQINFPCISYGDFKQMPRKWHFYPCHECDISCKKLCYTESFNPMNFFACIDFTLSKYYKIIVWLESYRATGYFQSLKPRKWHQKCIFFEADSGTSQKSVLAISIG